MTSKAWNVLKKMPGISFVQIVPDSGANALLITRQVTAQDGAIEALVGHLTPRCWMWKFDILRQYLSEVNQRALREVMW